jgi:hypothetical protein
LAECLLVYPVFNECDVTRHPFHFATMRHYQQRSDATKQLLIDQPEQYARVTLREIDLICYIANPQQPKIACLNRQHVAADCLLLSFNSSTCRRHGQIGTVAQMTFLSSPSQR